jgi:hypothetical protein
MLGGHLILTLNRPGRRIGASKPLCVAGQALGPVTYGVSLKELDGIT